MLVTGLGLERYLDADKALSRTDRVIEGESSLAGHIVRLHPFFAGVDAYQKLGCRPLHRVVGLTLHLDCMLRHYRTTRDIAGYVVNWSPYSAFLEKLRTRKARAMRVNTLPVLGTASNTTLCYV